jgi:FtsP/CotA-like multicopper oxidase with cupredoxin domain
VSIYDSNGKCIPGIVAGDAQYLADQYCGLYHVFRDTLFIENSYAATLRTHYARYTGEFVLHCHILDHEDAGMMANVVIADDPAHPPPREKVLMPTMNHHPATQQ